MPNRDFHCVAGAAVGAAYAAYQSKEETRLQQVVEALGGAFGGYVGGRLPDVIDPPVSPRHRSIGHGAVPVALAAWGAISLLDQWQIMLRRKAFEVEAARDRLSNDALRAGYTAFAALLRLLAGLLAGLVAGYVSHVALDSMTPCGLPFIA